MQSRKFIQLLFGRAGVSLAAQSEGKTVVCLLEVGFEFDGATKCRDGARRVAVGFQFAAEVVLSVHIVGIECRGLAKLIERALVVCLTTQKYAQHEVRGRKTGIQLDRATELGGSFSQIA